MIEQLKVDESYYNNYLKKHYNENLLNIQFKFQGKSVINLRISSNTKIKEMIKMFLYQMKIPEDNKNDFSFIFNCSILNPKDNCTL